MVKWKSLNPALELYNTFIICAWRLCDSPNKITGVLQKRWWEPCQARTTAVDEVMLRYILTDCDYTWPQHDDDDDDEDDAWTCWFSSHPVFRLWLLWQIKPDRRLVDYVSTQFPEVQSCSIYVFGTKYVLMEQNHVLN